MFGVFVSAVVSLVNPSPEFPIYDPLDSTRLVLIDQVIIEGNRRTNEDIILREMELRSGEEYPMNQLEVIKKGDRERIYNTRLFNSVEISIEQDGEDQVDIKVSVAERWYTFPSPILELVDRNFNDWWVNENHDLSRINYGIKLYQLNMRGRNETLKLTAQFGFTRKYALSYEIPYIDKSQRNGLEMGFAYSENNNISVRTVEHKRDFFDAGRIILNTTNLEIIYRKRPTFYDYHYFELSFRNSVISDTVVTLNDNYFVGGEMEQRFLSIAYGYRRDKRDVIAYPLQGSKFDVSVRKTGLGVFGDLDYWTFFSTYSKYVDLTRGFYLSNHVAAFANSTKRISYNNYYGLGYNNHYVRGYELYLVEGPTFILNKTSLRKRIFSRTANLDFVPLEQFRKLPIQVYFKAYFDMGYVDNYSGYTPNTLLSNRFLYGGGIGLDFVTWYDVVIRTEFSGNHLGEQGFFIHFRKEF